jgi:phosphoglycolate phosphatase
MKLRAVLFDLDGTLLDTLEDLADSMNAVLAGRGYPIHPVEAYKHFIGQGFAVLTEKSLPPEAHDPSFVAACVAEAKRQYASRWTRRTRPYPGIPALLDELADRGVKMAILSNKPHEFTRVMVAHFLDRWTFAAVLGGREGYPAKPDPAAAREICEALGLPAGEVLYAGDSGTDMETARNAGMTAVGVLWGFRDREELLAGGASALVAHPREILSFFPAAPPRR